MAVRTETYIKMQALLKSWAMLKGASWKSKCNDEDNAEGTGNGNIQVMMRMTVAMILVMIWVKTEKLKHKTGGPDEQVTLRRTPCWETANNQISDSGEYKAKDRCPRKPQSRRIGAESSPT